MNTPYYPTIGLEIHAELKTNSKMFCGCKNDPDETKQNTNICPVCMGHPGTLPVANKKAIEAVIRVGLAIDGTIADFSEFDRKNYFYPDIPKGYQISQYKYPIVSGGMLKGVAITRIHLEEDTGLSKHLSAQAGEGSGYSLVDYNRAGVPLMELVTEPVIKSAREAGDFARELQLLLRTLGVSEANLEKGEMRVEPNISLSSDPNTFGTKVEVKNLNSFKSVEKAIEYELARMQALYEAGREDEIVQETRGWDEASQKTFSQRSKENANDYRYFPDPDLPKMKLHSAFDLSLLQNELGELPWEKRLRYRDVYALKEADAEVFVADPMLSGYFEAVVEHLGAPAHAQVAANYIVSDLLGHLKKEPALVFPKPALFAELVEMAAAGEVTSRGAKDLLSMLLKEEASPRSLAKAQGLLQENDEEAIRTFAREVIAENEKIAADFRAGKEAALQALLGQVMKKSKGAANPALAAKALRELL